MSQIDYLEIGIFIIILVGGVLIGFMLQSNQINQNNLYEEIIKRFADTHTYNLTSYNCVNYSQDLSFILNSLGYNSSTIIVNNGTHMRIILNLEIEPQTAEIILKNEYS